jgi:hypothetical protein
VLLEQRCGIVHETGNPITVGVKGKAANAERADFYGSCRCSVDDGPNLGQGRRSKSRPRGGGYCAVLSALAEGKVSIPVSLSR